MDRERNKASHIAKIILAVLAVIVVISLIANFIGTSGERSCAKIVKAYQQELKDPDSMILCSDVLYLESEGVGVWCFSINGRNSFGQYAGYMQVEVIGENGTPSFYLTEDSDYFLHFADSINAAESSGIKAFDYTRYDGEKVARIAGCKYIR